jgi:hypothetical protein
LKILGGFGSKSENELHNNSTDCVKSAKIFASMGKRLEKYEINDDSHNIAGKNLYNKAFSY